MLTLSKKLKSKHTIINYTFTQQGKLWQSAIDFLCTYIVSLVTIDCGFKFTC